MFQRQLFDSRLVREHDALLITETFAWLIRQYGPPARPPVPSPLHRVAGLEDIQFDPSDRRTAFDFAQDSFASVLQVMRMEPDGRALHACAHDQPGFLTYDPARLEEPGYLVARLVIGLAADALSLFRPDVEPGPFGRATILLAGAAFFRAGLSLPRLLPATTGELSQFGVPARFVENTLLFASCLALSVARQTPEQIVATYGPILSKTARRKIRPACRQIDEYDTEVKLLRVLGQPEAPAAAFWGPRGLPRVAGAQPQRTSWI